MSEVFIPLGGAGGKNRGTAAVLGDSTPFSNAGAVMSLPLPAGNYKKSVSNPRTGYGDGKNSEVTISKELLKKMAIEAFGIASITNFKATMYAHKQVRLTWSRPNKGLWSGVHFIFKYGSMPDGIYDGFMPVDTADVHYETRPLQEGLLYIRAYSYVETNQGRWYDYDGTPVYTTIQVTGISGSVTLGAGAGTWTVPEGVRRIRYILVGHGGAGGTALQKTYGVRYSGQCGGGGGGYFASGYMDVSPGQALPWVVPTAQGQATVLNGVVANSGESPQFITIGTTQYNSIGGRGGSGGGGGSTLPDNYTTYGGNGGSNGSDGTYGASQSDALKYAVAGGSGQGASTQGFNGVLYSGGGGGAQHNRYQNKGGIGGAGGGGIASTGGSANGGNGTDGLGGGGGGASGSSTKYGILSFGGQGGTGCIYIAWGSSMNDGS